MGASDRIADALHGSLHLTESDLILLKNTVFDGTEKLLRLLGCASGG